MLSAFRICWAFCRGARRDQLEDIEQTAPITAAGPEQGIPLSNFHALLLQPGVLSEEETQMEDIREEVISAIAEVVMPELEGLKS